MDTDPVVEEKLLTMLRKVSKQEKFRQSAQIVQLIVTPKTLITYHSFKIGMPSFRAI